MPTVPRVVKRRDAGGGGFIKGVFSLDSGITRFASVNRHGLQKGKQHKTLPSVAAGCSRLVTTIVQDLAEFYRVLSATNADAILELAIVTAVDANCTPSPRPRLSNETRNSGSTGDELFLNQDMGRRPRFVLAHNN